MRILHKPKKLNQSGVHHILVPLLAFVLLFAITGAYVYARESKAASQPELRSGLTASGGPYCLDDHSDGGNGAEVDAWACNGTAAQDYSYDASTSEIKVGKGCIAVEGASANTGFAQAPVIISTSCSTAPWGGAWTMSGDTFHNNHADSKAGNGTWCLDIKGAKPEAAVEIYKCNGGDNQNWYPDTFTSTSTGGGGSGSGGGGTTTTTSNELRSGMTASGGPYCLDDKSDGGNGAEVDAWACNGTAAQHYSYDSSNSEIKVGQGCVAVKGASATTGFTQTPVVISTSCGTVPWGGAWTRSGDTFHNNHADSKSGNGTWCLDVTGAKAKASVEIYKCVSGAANQNWFSDTFTSTATSSSPAPINAAYTGQIISSADTSQCLTQAYGGDLVSMQPCVGDEQAQQWRESGNVQGVGPNTVQIFQNVSSNDYLNVANTTSGTDVYATDGSSGTHYWQVGGDGTLIAGVNTGGACLASSSATSGEELALSDCGSAMDWQLPSQTSQTGSGTDSGSGSTTSGGGTTTTTTTSQAQISQENEDLLLIIDSLSGSEKSSISCDQLQSAYAKQLLDCPQTTSD